MQFARSVSIVAGVAAAATLAAAYMIHTNVLQRTSTSYDESRVERKTPQVIKWADECTPAQSLAQEISFESSDAPLEITS
jgi:hypothetical protein